MSYKQAMSHQNLNSSSQVKYHLGGGQRRMEFSTKFPVTQSNDDGFAQRKEKSSSGGGHQQIMPFAVIPFMENYHEQKNNFIGCS
ncbi:hypothetical protein [Mucilaginibacter polytrichastri]|uniref:hypothetical protein n=1 Tax=Mucilaginibacter polytrichastri TaxID=1302689 RepID=UPI0008E2606A|nr:hypothetical protein [Mucilaginibacter polytrichastri]SFT08609.1 hypothetical protein SAMN04487890_11044 [Mucilaginibacter polytrichastri]